MNVLFSFFSVLQLQRPLKNVLSEWDKNFEETIRKKIFIGNEGQYSKEVIRDIRKFYFGDKGIAKEGLLQNLIDVSFSVSRY